MSEHRKPGSDDQVIPMTVLWMQNGDFGWGNELAIDRYFQYLLLVKLKSKRCDSVFIAPTDLYDG